MHGSVHNRACKIIALQPERRKNYQAQMFSSESDSLKIGM